MGQHKKEKTKEGYIWLYTLGQSLGIKLTSAHTVTHVQRERVSILGISKKMKKEDMVKLISAEGFEFVIDKDAAMVSQTIYNMLTSPGHLSLSLQLSILIRVSFWLKIETFFHKFYDLIGSFAETQHGEVTFPEISTTILEKICKYFYWHLQFARF